MLLMTPSIDEVIEQLSTDELNLLLIGEHCEVAIDELISRCKTLNIQIAGGIFPGVLSQKVNTDKGLIIRKMHASAQVVVFEGLAQKESFEFPELSGEFKSALVLVDGLSDKIAHFLEKVYNNYWDQIKFIGGGCGSLTLQQKPCVFTEAGILQDAALMIFSEQLLSLGVNHGWKKIAGPFVINSSDGNTIHEINWRPAFEVYQEVILKRSSLRISKENFFDIAKGYPFGIFKEGMEDVVRDPIITDGKSLTCVGEIMPNSVVNILEGKTIDLIEGAKIAAERAFDDEHYQETLVIDCISRTLFQEKDFVKELLAVNNVIKRQERQFNLEGVLSLGEISSYGDGYLEFFNKTIVVGALKDYD